MNEIDIAYMAGFFDGEGTVNITWKLRPRGYYTAITKLAVYNSCPSTLHLFDHHFDGLFYHLNDTRPRNHPVEMWQCAARERKHFMTTLLPYMREVRKCWRVHFILEHEELLLNPKRLTTQQLHCLTNIKAMYDLNAEPRSRIKE